jgi:hypothetical protein
VCRAPPSSSASVRSPPLHPQAGLLAQRRPRSPPPPSYLAPASPPGRWRPRRRKGSTGSAASGDGGRQGGGQASRRCRRLLLPLWKRQQGQISFHSVLRPPSPVISGGSWLRGVVRVAQASILGCTVPASPPSRFISAS